MKVDFSGSMGDMGSNSAVFDDVAQQKQNPPSNQVVCSESKVPKFADLCFFLFVILFFK